MQVTTKSSNQLVATLASRAMKEISELRLVPTRSFRPASLEVYADALRCVTCSLAADFVVRVVLQLRTALTSTAFISVVEISSLAARPPEETTS